MDDHFGVELKFAVYLDPGKTVLKVTEAAADLKLYNSKSAYPSPRNKERYFSQIHVYLP